MIFSVRRKDFLAQVKKVSAAATYNNPQKILSGICIEADERLGVIRLCATNLEVAIRIIIPASIESGGDIVIDSRLFGAILEKLDGDEVHFELNKNYLSISSGQARFDIPALPDEFPKLDLPVPGNTVSVTGLKSLALRSIFAAGDRETRPHLQAVSLTLDSTGLHAAATNGHCISHTSGDKDCTGKVSLLVPALSMKLLASISEDSDVFDMGITGEGGKSLVFDDGTLLFTTRLLSGSVLDADKYFSKIEVIAEAKTNSTDLKQGLDNIRALSANTGRVGITFTKKGLELSCLDENVSGSTLVAASMTGVSGKCNYFMLAELLACVRVLSGDISLGISEQGYLMLKNGNTRYFQLPVKKPISKPVEEKPKKKPSRKKAA